MLCSELDRDGDGRVSFKDFDFAMKYNVDNHFWWDSLMIGSLTSGDESLTMMTHYWMTHRWVTHWQWFRWWLTLSALVFIAVNIHMWTQVILGTFRIQMSSQFDESDLLKLIVSWRDLELEVQIIQNEEKPFDCSSCHVGRWIVNETTWKTVPKLQKSFFKTELQKPEFSVFEFRGLFVIQRFHRFCTSLVLLSPHFVAKRNWSKQWWFWSWRFLVKNNTLSLYNGNVRWKFCTQKLTENASFVYNTKTKH